MSDNYYIRIRGRVHGPMDLDRLQGLAQKGQLSKIHELSTDSKNWRPASSMPEIFERKREVAVIRTTGQQEQTIATSNNLYDNTQLADPLAQPPGVQSGPPQGAMQAKDWFYSIDGAQHGPVTQQELATLIRYGSLEREDMVWQSSMAQWAEAGHVPALVSVFPKGRRNAKGNNTSRNNDSYENDGPLKSKTTAMLLALFLGTFGIHQFYMGNSLKGIIFVVLMITLVGFLINPFWALIDVIIIACQSEEGFQRMCNKGMGMSF